MRFTMNDQPEAGYSRSGVWSWIVIAVGHDLVYDFLLQSGHSQTAGDFFHFRLGNCFALIDRLLDAAQ